MTKVVSKVGCATCTKLAFNIFDLEPFQVVWGNIFSNLHWFSRNNWCSKMIGNGERMQRSQLRTNVAIGSRKSVELEIQIKWVNLYFGRTEISIGTR